MPKGPQPPKSTKLPRKLPEDPIARGVAIKGPQGQKRPADVTQNAVQVMRIATGQEPETGRDPGTEANRKGGLKGGKARAEKLSAEQRKAIAERAAQTRWKK